MSALSVVLPVFNGAERLSAAVESCLRQGDALHELIVVDDGSSDESYAIAERHARDDARVRAVRLGRNVGLPAALDVGSRLATAAAMTWTSDDNVLLPGALAQLADRLAATGADVVWGPYVVRDETGAETVRHPVGPSGLARSNSIGAYFAYTADIYDRAGGYDASLMGAEDYEFWLRCLRAGATFESVEQPHYVYVLHGGSLTSTRQRLIQRRTLTARRRHVGTIFRRLGPQALPRFALEGVRNLRRGRSTS